MTGVPPAWATVWGQDRFGVFAGFEVGGVEYRLRWIEGGRFVMGSPKGEAGRFDSKAYDETQHEVEVSGFWLGETVVTQALWQAITGDNPSRFRSPERPVENVSYNDCEEMLRRLNAMPGLEMRLPTEAQWEFACRAGTTTATYAGDLEILGERNAPILDAIAWYGGNSGEGFELDSGEGTSNWPEKQYPHSKAGSRPVALKVPNDLGLYDMLGNVWEWCADWLGEYSKEFQRNPTGPSNGVNRVFRGGSWHNRARYVRAADRNGSPPDFRSGNLGVRLSRGQGELLGAEPLAGPEDPRVRARGARGRLVPE